MSSISKNTSSSSSSSTSFEDDLSLRRGPWTLQEDSLLVHYISLHGEGRWNLLAKCAGLRRTDKSCRLRWLNYLKPDVKRGNFSPHEQLLILDLHSKLGNRWSKIAKSLPGRTDNEIKNYWRTRVQKQAKHLKIDANSTVFQEIIRRFWMPRLLQKIQADSTISSSHPPVHYVDPPPPPPPPPPLPLYDPYSDSNTSGSSNTEQYCSITNMSQFYKSQTINPNFYDLDGQNITTNGSYVKDFYYHVDINENMLAVPGGLGDRHVAESDWVGSCDFGDNMWSMDQLMTI